MTDLFLRKGADRRLRGGHLWVYSNEVDSQRSPLGAFAAGDLVMVRAADGALIGSAYMEPQSLICARIYARGEQRPLDETFFRERLASALLLRETAFAEPCYRLVYGDSDGLPGLVIDRFNDVRWLRSSRTAVSTSYREHLKEALVDVLEPAGILLRADSRGRREQGVSAETAVLAGEVPDQVPLTENGVQFLAPVYAGQKTGWFYDHRESRARLAGGSRANAYWMSTVISAAGACRPPPSVQSPYALSTARARRWKASR